MLNPYTPNAGAEPPAVVGRDDLMTSFRVLLARLSAGRTSQSMIITGLRGVGKTVLLNNFRRQAIASHWVVIEAEVTKHPDDVFRRSIAAWVRSALFELSPRARWSERLQKASPNSRTTPRPRSCAASPTATRRAPSPRAAGCGGGWCFRPRSALYESKLDSSFFRVRLDRTTELQRVYLRAMAELGPEPQKASDVAQVTRCTSSQVAPTRAELLSMGLLDTPQHGYAAFTVPHFDRFMHRAVPDLVAPEVRRRQKRS